MFSSDIKALLHCLMKCGIAGAFGEKPPLAWSPGPPQDVWIRPRSCCAQDGTSCFVVVVVVVLTEVEPSL